VIRRSLRIRNRLGLHARAAARFVTLVVAPRVFVQVALKMFFRDAMKHTVQTALHQRPKSFDGVGVNIPAHVDFGRVVDAVVGVAKPGEVVVRLEFVGDCE
jgi:hypothetical protein